MGAYQTVLVGTDGSDSSYRAVDRAAEIARDATARLVIVCAYEPATPREVAAAEDVLGDEAFSVVGSAPAEETLRTAAERAAALSDHRRLADLQRARHSMAQVLHRIRLVKNGLSVHPDQVKGIERNLLPAASFLNRLGVKLAQQKVESRDGRCMRHRVRDC